MSYYRVAVAVVAYRNKRHPECAQKKGFSPWVKRKSVRGICIACIFFAILFRRCAVLPMLLFVEGCLIAAVGKGRQRCWFGL